MQALYILPVEIFMEGSSDFQALDIPENDIAAGSQGKTVEEIRLLPKEKTPPNIESTIGELMIVADVDSGQIECEALSAICDIASASNENPKCQKENDVVKMDATCDEISKESNKVVDTEEKATIKDCIVCQLCPPKFNPRFRVFTRTENKIMALNAVYRQILLSQPLVVLDRCTETSVKIAPSTTESTGPSTTAGDKRIPNDIKYKWAKSMKDNDKTKSEFDKDYDKMEPKSDTTTGSKDGVATHRDEGVAKKIDSSAEMHPKVKAKDDKSAETIPSNKNAKLVEMAQRLKAAKERTSSSKSAQDKEKGRGEKSQEKIDIAGATKQDNKINNAASRPPPLLNKVIQTPALPAFKIKKIDSKAVGNKSTHSVSPTKAHAVATQATQRNQPIAYISPLDRILDETNRFTNHSSINQYESKFNSKEFRKYGQKRVVKESFPIPGKHQKIDENLNWRNSHNIQSKTREGEYETDALERNAFYEPPSAALTDDAQFKDNCDQWFDSNLKSFDSQLKMLPSSGGMYETKQWAEQVPSYEAYVSPCYEANDSPVDDSSRQSQQPPTKRPALLYAPSSMLDRDQNDSVVDSHASACVGDVNPAPQESTVNLNSFLDDVLRKSRQSALLGDAPAAIETGDAQTSKQRPSLLGSGPPRNPGLLITPASLVDPLTQPLTAQSALTADPRTLNDRATRPTILGDKPISAASWNKPDDVTQTWQANDKAIDARHEFANCSSRPVLLSGILPSATFDEQNYLKNRGASDLDQSTSTIPLVTGFATPNIGLHLSQGSVACDKLPLNEQPPPDFKKLLRNEEKSSQLRVSDAQSYFLSNLTNDNLSELLKQVEAEEENARRQMEAPCSEKQEASKNQVQDAKELDAEIQEQLGGNVSDFARSVHEIWLRRSSDKPDGASKNPPKSVAEKDGERPKNYSVGQKSSETNEIRPNIDSNENLAQKPSTSQRDVDYRQKSTSLHTSGSTPKMSRDQLLRNSSQQIEIEDALAQMLSDRVDDSALRSFLLDVLDELKKCARGSVVRSDCEEITQLKVVFQTLLSEPTSVLGQNAHMRRKVENIVPLLDIARFLDSSAAQTAFIMPVMQFAQDLIEMSFT